MRHRRVLLGLALLAAAPSAAGDSPMLEQILRADARLAPIVARAPEHRLQVLLGLVEHGSDGPRLVHHGFRADAEYFYPASTVKLLAAVAALERLTGLARDTGLPIDADTPLVYRPLFAGETVEAEDPSNRDGAKITVRHEIRKLFLVSDNVAFNRLYELVGPAELDRSARRAGLDSVRLVHRLSEARTPAENLRLPSIEFRGDGFRHVLPERTDRLDLPALDVPGLRVGRAYLAGGDRTEGAMDFRSKNRVSLVDLQRALCQVVRPDVDAGGPGFRLSVDQRALLVDAMAPYPRQSANPVYDAEEYPDHWVKFLLPGLRRVVDDERLRIDNKIGRAYGFSVENAYVTDRATGRSFFLAAVLYTNRNGVLNDDQYEYEEVADPFLANLGEAVARALWFSDTPSKD